MNINTFTQRMFTAIRPIKLLFFTAMNALFCKVIICKLKRSYTFAHQYLSLALSKFKIYNYEKRFVNSISGSSCCCFFLF
jgi:hypothetical protein